MSDNHTHTPLGQRIEGTYENDRNAENADLFRAIVREAFDVQDCIIAHHIVYVTVERRGGFDYQIVQEIPCADSLMFNHEIARKLWGDYWREVLTKLACEPVETRDELLKCLYYGRKRDGVLVHGLIE